MSFTEAVSSVLRQYATFRGRATRAEYWWFYLFTVVVAIGAGAIDGAAGTDIVGTVVTLALLIPSVAVFVRRLHDSDLAGWWILAPILTSVTSAGLLVVGLFGALLSAFEGASGPGMAAFGALVVLGVVLALAALVLSLVLLLRPSTTGPNRFGPGHEPTVTTPYGGPAQPDPYGPAAPYGGPGRGQGQGQA